jgi:hypothetical protein
MAKLLVIPVITGSALAATAVFTAARAVRAGRRSSAPGSQCITNRFGFLARLRVEEETAKTSLETQITAGTLSNQDRRDLSTAG